MAPTTLPVFTPTAVPASELAARTVGREELIERLLDRVRHAATSAGRPHTLVVGPRGSGKTHLLAVLLYRLGLDPLLAGRVAVAWLPEDAHSVASYDDLLFEMVIALGPPPSVAREAARLRGARDGLGLERMVGDLAGGRVVLAVVENLNRVFDGIGEDGQGRLRAWVETEGAVLVLATAPLLFADVADRERPWYGSFVPEHLADLTLEEGTELLRLLGDPELAAFLETPTGSARLHAVERLAGGSPRLWTVLAGCLTVEALDELVPAVEKLVDELVPYFQQRLWELGGVEQKLVTELCRSGGLRTVKDLALSTGVDERAAATSLGRLEDARWVRRSKQPGTDGRTSWYEVREPLLRHHLQYRSARGEPLRLIVSFLRAWFDEPERRSHLARADLGSTGERYLVAALDEGGAHRFDDAYDPGDLDWFLSEARCWVRGQEGDSRWFGSPPTGIVVEAIVLAARREAWSVAHRLASVDEQVAPAVAELARTGAAAALAPAGVSGDDRLAERVAAGLRAVREGAGLAARDRVTLGLLAACWQEPAEAARDQLARLAERAVALHPNDDRLVLAVRHELAHYTGEAGDRFRARDLSREVLDDATRKLGDDHPDVMAHQHAHAYWVGRAGDPAKARDLFTAAVASRSKVLGADHPRVLASRHNHAYWTGIAGDVPAASQLFASVAADRSRVLGLDNVHTILSRHGHANWLGRAGLPEAAKELMDAVVDDYRRVLGPDDPRTLEASHDRAHWTGWAGKPGQARELFEAVVAGRSRVLGSSDPATLLSRLQLAIWTYDFAVARELFEAVAADAERSLGPAHALTRSAREEVASAARVSMGQPDQPVGGAHHPYPTISANLQKAIGAAIGSSSGLAGQWAAYAVRSLGTVRGPLDRWMVSALADSLDGRPASEPAVAILRAVAQAIDGDRTALLGLPTEIRQVVEEALGGP